MASQRGGGTSAQRGGNYHKRVGEYQLFQQLGRGTFATVYYAKSDVGKEVALKQLAKDKLIDRDGKLLANLEQEVSFLRTHEHENIVALYDIKVGD